MKRSSFALIFLLAGCVSDAPRTAEDSAVVARTTADSNIAAEKAKLIPPGESAPAPTSPPPGEPEKEAGEWDVTPAGIGEIRAGMSLDEAKVVMQNNLVIPAKLGECDYVKPKTGPKGVNIMVEKGEIARVEVISGTIATTESAKIGDTEERIKSLYPGQVEVQPHKYTDGHYLVVTPKSAGNNRLVFETDGKKVLRYRSGRLPAVQYVEGCS